MTAPSRMRTTTQRVETPFAALYVHLSTDDAGRAREVSISTPGKHHDTAMGVARPRRNLPPQMVGLRAAEFIAVSGGVNRR